MKKTAIITGAYGVIGRAISEMMAESGYRLVLVGRDGSKMKQVTEEIKTATGEMEVHGYGVDLSRKREIRAFAEALELEPDVLINNAGTTPDKRLETPEGIEMQWATNVLGYVWMMDAISPKMKPGSRIVNVASFYAGELDMNDPEFKLRRYDNDTAYRQSKQANRMLSTWYAGLLKDKRVSVNSCHPGEISSKLSNNLGFFFPDPPRKGADTPVWLATADELVDITGKYYQYRQEIPCRFSDDDRKNGRLYDLCKGY
jgi:NAD(P)-dependent dehydrogenase (short-subunit alcohol dehydrogenase family)